MKEWIICDVWIIMYEVVVICVVWIIMYGGVYHLGCVDHYV